MEPIAKCDGEVAVMSLVRVWRAVHLPQTEIIAGVQRDVTVFIRKTHGNAEVDRLTEIRPLFMITGTVEWSTIPLCSAEFEIRLL